MYTNFSKGAWLDKTGIPLKMPLNVLRFFPFFRTFCTLKLAFRYTLVHVRHSEYLFLVQAQYTHDTPICIPNLDYSQPVCALLLDKLLFYPKLLGERMCYHLFLQSM